MSESGFPGGDRNDTPPCAVELYVDGGCQPNPGPGGYGVVLLCGGSHCEISGGFRRTTNNRMEIRAAIAGLRALIHPCAVTVYSDSRYVVNAMSRGWARRWQARKWRRTETEMALNPDLWEELLKLCERHQVSFKWIRGHSGKGWNERCDRLASQARIKADLPLDPGYEHHPGPGVAPDPEPVRKPACQLDLPGLQ